MSLKGITIHEGYNDLGHFEVDVTSVEIPVLNSASIPAEIEQSSLFVLFKLMFLANGEPIPPEYVAQFTVLGMMPDENLVQVLNTNTDGFVQVNVPAFPVVVKKPEGVDTVIDYDVTGPLNERIDEAYLELDNGGAGLPPLYTLITDIVIKDGFLKIFDGQGNYYKILPEIPIANETNAIHITAEGQVFGFNADPVDPSSGMWIALGTLIFNSIEFPENLTSFSDGFYETTPSSGTITPSPLGTGPFADFKGIVNNPEPYFVNIDLELRYPDGSVIWEDSYVNLMPGSLDYKPVFYDGAPYSPPDASPTITEIETVSGVTFSTTFRDFLIIKGLTTVDKIRKAGPITYVSDFPAGLPPAEVELLQGHVDLYSINSDINQNQHIIGGNYNNIFRIANTPKDIFLNDVVGATLPLFKAAQIHEVSVQNLNLVGNLLSGTLVDMKLATPATPPLTGSTFASEQLAKAVSSCGCDDCKSAVSPFAYLMDLIKYAASHVEHTASPIYKYGVPPNIIANNIYLTNFISLLENTFLQPFGALNVDCKTLHDEFCRVRLVTEVLEKWVDIRIAGGFSPPTAAQIIALSNERKQYLTLTYQSILRLAGTSLDELRNVVTASPASEKIKLAQALSDKLGIPLYIAPTTNFSVDRLYLTLNNLNPPNVLNAVNLEAVFGFRDTKRNVLTPTPVSLMEQLQSAYLRNVWKAQDYLLNEYSREGVNPASDPTFKSNWLPIIDPDNFGWIDFTYNPYIYAKNIWQRRKEDTDAFLSEWSGNTISNFNISRTAADMKGQILRVSDRDIVTQEIEGDLIQIYNGVNWNTNFEVLNRNLVGTDTDVILKKSTITNPQPGFFQPQDSTDPPKMRYKRVIEVVTTIPTGQTTFTLNWPEPVIIDKLTNGYAKLISSGDTGQVFETSNFTLTINNFTATSVNLTVSSLPSTGFINGNVQFIYEVEVPLVYDYIIDPVTVSTRLFTIPQSYTLLPTTPTSNPALPVTFNYPALPNNSVWNVPTWTGITGANDFERLKNLYQKVTLGTATDIQLAIITNDLYMDFEAFNRMMKLLITCENYLAASYTSPRPTNEEIYELASIFRSSAKTQLRDIWVKEEIKHWANNTSTPIVLRLDSLYFWKALEEPITGSWDPSLQTIPALAANINSSHIAIIDPELLNKSELNQNPDIAIKAYRDLYDQRVSDLEAQHNLFEGLLIPILANGYEESLNYVNTNNPYNAYNISPYTSLQDLINDLNSNDPFKVKEATEITWNAFRITREDFLVLAEIKGRYEANNPENVPSISEIEKTIKMLVSGYKRIWLYGDNTAGWIYDEVTGSFPNGTPVFYYNVRKMRLAPGRSETILRTNWQNTLASWNRQPFIQPDIASPENIKNFVPSNWVYTTWNSRYTALNGDYNNLATNFIFDTGDSSILLDNIKRQIDLIIGKINSYTPVAPPFEYYPYFDAITSLEDSGEDIRPVLDQFNIAIEEYRFLSKIIKVLAAAGAGPVPLVESEYQDAINILIRIHSLYTPFSKVLDEYDNNIVLDQDYFQIFKPAPISFPINNIVPDYNKWRSPYKDRKLWLDTLQGRIDREKAVIDKWKDILLDAEDQNMPLLRDALIRALTNNCETWQEAAERLAKTFFIETKDNCCVKHTRVSFAIETLQGLVYALETGIYDDFVTNFKLIAPDFKEEWKWIGSYASWRSAMFVFLYPENLLYPTLKRLQSPAFISLGSKLQTANRVTPEDACHLAQGYQKYLNDIQNLNIICTASAISTLYQADPNACCPSSFISASNTKTYYFAWGPSGTHYYSSKVVYDYSKDALSFWEPLPIPREGVQLLGAYVLTTSPGLNTLYVFYGYWDNKYKVAYIKKNVIDINSTWSVEKETGDLYEYNGAQPIGITACQQSVEAEPATFILTYNNPSSLSGALHHVISTYSQYNDKWETPLNPSNWQPYTHVYETKKPFTALRIKVKTTNPNVHINAVCYGFNKSTGTDTMFIQGFTGTSGSVELIDGSVGLESFFESPTEDSAIISIEYNPYSATRFARKHLIRASVVASNYVFSGIGDIDTSTLTISSEVKSLTAIYPSSSLRLGPRLFAAKGMANNIPISLMALIQSGSGTGKTFNLHNVTALTLANVPYVGIVSADCVSNMDARKINVETLIKKNMNTPTGFSPLGFSAPDILRSTTLKEVLFEAYYYVPMLLALDQQKRGQYETALNWYRSIYDYTNPLVAKRKISYNLVLEESIISSFVQASNWLLDPLNPHLIAQMRANAYTKYTLMNVIQCLYGYADREFTMDTIETVPRARKLYTTALELLEVPEIKAAINQCLIKANGCLDTQTDLSTNKVWSSLYSELKDNLASIGDATLIESLSHDIADVLNSGTEDTLGEKFAESFEMIETSTPAPPTPETLIQFMEGKEERMNNASRYLFALNDPDNYNIEVGQMYAANIGGLIGMQAEEVSSPEAESKLTWLLEPIPANDVDYQFSFAATDGKQYFPGDLAYDPFSPTSISYDTNLNFTNAKAISPVNPVSPYIPFPYTPLIDFKFCTPSNPIYNALLLKGNLELYKIFNCRNIAGMVRELDVFAAATDSTTGVPVIGASGNLVLPGANNFAPTQYRFKVLLERAKEIAQQAQQLESLFLAALEKEDAENYSLLRARQDLETARATVKLQDLRITQATNEKGLADLQLGKVTFIQSHFNNLLASGFNGFEIASLALLQASAGAQIAAGILAIIQAVANNAKAVIPVASGGSGGSLDFGASAVSLFAGALSTQASFFAQFASYQRRAQEWEFQSQLAGLDIGIANQQIKIAEDNIRITGQEREIAVLNTNHTENTIEYLKNKFTNADLYNWMGNILESAYSYMLNLSTATARTAERQLYFERQEQAGPFILDDYWELPSSGFTGGTSSGQPDRRGLTGSARLLVDIQRLDQFAFETNKRKLQMTKVISLAQNFPAEFQAFKETGVLNFELTNKLFDYDFPGHYLRLINNVKTSVVGLLPVYDSIKATLTIEPTTYTVIGGTTFQRIPIRRLEVDSVALTGANNATGLFELQPVQTSELLNPFEGMGIESRWEFKMPQFSNRMDFENIADVVISVDYTALDSFQYRYQVLQDLDNTLAFNRGFSFRNNFPDQWFELGEAIEGSPEFGVEFELKREFFPVGIQNLQLDGTDIVLYFSREDGFEDEVEVLDFNLANANNTIGGETNEGRFPTTGLMTALGNNPLQKFRLKFDNTAINRALFSEGKIKDILLLVGCKAELKTYPL